MKTIIRFVKYAALSAALFGTEILYAQDGVEELIKSSPANATKLSQAYLNPLFKGFGIGLNSGWFNTANAKNTGRFELRFSANAALIPTADQSFDVNQLGLTSNVRVKSGTSPISSSVSGKGQQAILEVYDNNNNLLETFTMPNGANLRPIPGLQLQGTVGLPRGIDVTLRGMPEVDLGDAGKVNMIGGGVRLEILPLITGKLASKLLPFDVAVAVGYTELNYEKALTVNAPAGSVSDPAKPSQSQDFSNQSINAKLSGINTQLIVSKKLLFFTPFASVGYQTSKTDANLLGNYPIVTGAITPTTKTYTTFNNPISINQKYLSGMHADLGFQLNLAFLRIYGSYSMGEYNSANAGIGFGIGK